MKKFDIFRYFRKFGILIFLVAVLGFAATYLYTKTNQKYTATATIKYTNSEIEDGLNPDGSKLDVSEVYSSSVISQAMDFLGEPGPLNIIRSRCYVQKVIPAEQKAINDALIDKGEDVTYIPDTYKINLVVDGRYGEQYARNALDAILQSYCTFYTEKYVEGKLSINPSSGLLENGYDYYECIRILENDTNDMIEFLKAKKDDYPDFRSSKTGYSYKDLYDIYMQFKNYVLPELYAKVLKGPQMKDGVVLKNHIANDIAQSQQNEAVQKEQRKKITDLVDNYVEKNLGMPGEMEDGDTIASDYILDHIEEEKGSGANAETTYDGLILEIVGIDKNIAGKEIDRGFDTEILEKFNGISSVESGSSEEHSEIEQLINEYEGNLSKYYDIVSATGKELNLAVSADYLKMLSTVRVYPAINSKMYLTLSLILFFIIGCLGAIVLGRFDDMVAYILYTDKKTGMPNRDKLNIYISELAGKLVPDDYSCIIVTLDNLEALTKRYGYSVGDGALKDFADIIKVMGDTDGVMGYNGAGNYYLFFDKCNEKKAEAIIKILHDQVETYNNVNKNYPIEYSAASATSTALGVYDIRELIRAALAKLNENKKKNGDNNK